MQFAAIERKANFSVKHLYNTRKHCSVDCLIPLSFLVIITKARHAVTVNGNKHA